MSKKDESFINIIYNIKEEDRKCGNINIFGLEFVKNNRVKCKMIIDNKEYKITEQYNIENYIDNELKIKLKGINNITNISGMFRECKSLLSLSDISKWNINNVANMSFMFCGYSSLSSLPDISKWNTNKVKDMSYMFNECSFIIFT